MTTEKCVGIVWPEFLREEHFHEVKSFFPPEIRVEMIGTQPTPPLDNIVITLDQVLKDATSTNIEKAAKKLVPLGVASIGYACTSHSYVHGLGGAIEIADRIKSATGIPATTTSSALINALRYLNIDKIGVLSPHVDELNERLEQFLTDNGFTVVRMAGLGILRRIEDLPPEEIRELIVNTTNCPNADGIFISCTSMMTSSIINEVEQTLGKPVVSANQATAWDVLRLAGMRTSMTGLSKLYSTH